MLMIAPLLEATALLLGGVGLLVVGARGVQPGGGDVGTAMRTVAIMGAMLFGLVLAAALSMDIARPVFLWMGAIALGFVGFMLWLLVLIDCVTQEPNEGNVKVTWAAILVRTGVIGAALYWKIRRPQRITELGR